MILQDMVLIVCILVCLFAGLVLMIKGKEVHRIANVYFLPLLFTLIHILVFHNNLFMYVIYASSVIMVGLYFLRKKKITYGIVWVLVLILNVTIIAFPIKMDSKDYASLGYYAAFEKLHSDIENEYALVDYKSIDLDALHEKYAAKIKKAEKEKNKTAYLQALQNYVEEFHDGHVNVYDMLEFFGVGSMQVLTNSKKELFPNYYGMSLLKLNSGEYIAVNVKEDGSAYKAGIREGYLITKWDDKPVAEQAGEITNLTPVNSWTFADQENIGYYQAFYLSCMGGKVMNVTYIKSNLDSTANSELAIDSSINTMTQAEKTVTLSTMGNGYDYLYETVGKFNHKKNNSDTKYELNENIVCEIKGDICHLEIDGFLSTKVANEKKMEEVSEQINKANVKRIIVDIRNNQGGDDEIAAVITGYFAKKNMFYLEENTYDNTSKKYDKLRTIEVKAKNKITQPVTLLVNSQCISAGEGFAYNMAKLEQVQVAGITGTNGSFGTFKGIHIMPENVMVVFPYIICLDKEGQVMIDSSANRIGGVKPDVIIPLNRKGAKTIFSTDQDYELDYVMQMK